MMTTTEIEILIAQWGNDPSPPVPRNPWERPRDPSGRQAAIKAALKHRPDLGWAFARRCADSRRHCPVLKRPEFRWIRAACKLLTGDAAASRHLRDVAVVAQAKELHDHGEMRPVLDAVLMTRDATLQSVADALKISPAVLEAYHCLFFSVLDRKDDLAYLRKILDRGQAASLFLDHPAQPGAADQLLAAGYQGSIEVVLRLAGFAPANPGSDSDPEHVLLQQLSQKVLRAGVDYFDSPGAWKKTPPAVVSQAIDIVKKSKMEGASDSYDPGSLGDFATAARSILMQDVQTIRDGIEHQMSLAGQ